MTLVARLKVTLSDVEPQVLRRFDVPLKIKLNRLHDVIQAAMGWTDSHLYEFRAGGPGWGVPDPDGYYDGPLPANKSSLLDVVEDAGTKTIHYIYDFGDNWHHVIKVEKIDDAIPGADYPRLVRAIGACPPEDVGAFPDTPTSLTPWPTPNTKNTSGCWNGMGKSSTLKRPGSVASSTTSSASPKSGPKNPANQRQVQNPFDQERTSAAFGGCLRIFPARCTRISRGRLRDTASPGSSRFCAKAQGGVPVSELCGEHGMSTASFYKWRTRYGGRDAWMIAPDQGT